MRALKLTFACTLTVLLAGCPWDDDKTDSSDSGTSGEVTSEAGDPKTPASSNLDMTACIISPVERKFAMTAYFSRATPVQIGTVDKPRYVERGVLMVGGVKTDTTISREVWLLDLTHEGAVNVCPWVQLEHFGPSGIYGGQMIYRQAADEFVVLGGYVGSASSFASSDVVYRAKLESGLLAGGAFAAKGTLGIEVAPTYGLVDGECATRNPYLRVGYVYDDDDGRHTGVCKREYKACNFGGSDTTNTSSTSCPLVFVNEPIPVSSGLNADRWHDVCANTPECDGSSRTVKPSGKGKGLAHFALAYSPTRDEALLVGGTTGCEGSTTACAAWDGLFPTQLGVTPSYAAGEGRSLVNSNKAYVVTFTDGDVSAQEISGIDLGSSYDRSTTDSNSTMGVFGATATLLDWTWSRATREIVSSSSEMRALVQGGTRYQSISDAYSTKIETEARRCCYSNSPLVAPYDCTDIDVPWGESTTDCPRYSLAYDALGIFASADKGVVKAADALKEYRTSTKLTAKSVSTDPRWGTAMASTSGESTVPAGEEESAPPGESERIYWYGGTNGGGAVGNTLYETNLDALDSYTMPSAANGASMIYDPIGGDLIVLGGATSAAPRMRAERVHVKHGTAGATSTMKVDEAEVNIVYNGKEWSVEEKFTAKHTCTSTGAGAATHCYQDTIQLGLPLVNDADDAEKATIEVSYGSPALSTKLWISTQDWDCDLKFCWTQLRLPRVLYDGDSVSVRVAYEPVPVPSASQHLNLGEYTNEHGDKEFELRAPALLYNGADTKPIQYTTTFSLPTGTMGFALFCLS